VLNSDMLRGVKENFTERILSSFFIMDNRNKDTKEEKTFFLSNSKGISWENFK
jgi:hypothetical protein